MFEGYRQLIREHVYDKCWSLDITWAEVELLLDSGEVVEEHTFDDQRVKEIRLLLDWVRPLHVVYVVDHGRKLVVYRTIYEPDPQHWNPGYRERRR